YLEATGGRKDKIIFGLSNDYGGTEWTCRGDGPRAPIVGKPRRLGAAEARAKAEKHGRLFDDRQKAPWYRYRDGEHWVQGWYEDEESLKAKLEWLRGQGVAGICLWVLDAKEPPETYRLLAEGRSK
ncbi:MAG TPA: hypothetical protein VEJ18_10730, partial [Planctomycetota bacterium]|nr:hypothetical protein [Planctomycetota bacterium]